MRQEGNFNHQTEGSVVCYGNNPIMIKLDSSVLGVADRSVLSHAFTQFNVTLLGLLEIYMLEM